LPSCSRDLLECAVIIVLHLVKTLNDLHQRGRVDRLARFDELLVDAGGSAVPHVVMLAATAWLVRCGTKLEHVVLGLECRAQSTVLHDELRARQVQCMYTTRDYIGGRFSHRECVCVCVCVGGGYLEAHKLCV
jgi:hypothetical protein